MLSLVSSSLEALFFFSHPLERRPKSRINICYCYWDVLFEMFGMFLVWGLGFTVICFWFAMAVPEFEVTCLFFSKMKTEKTIHPQFSLDTESPGSSVFCKQVSHFFFLLPLPLFQRIKFISTSFVIVSVEIAGPKYFLAVMLVHRISSNKFHIKFERCTLCTYFQNISVCAIRNGLHSSCMHEFVL